MIASADDGIVKAAAECLASCAALKPTMDVDQGWDRFRDEQAGVSPLPWPNATRAVAILDRHKNWMRRLPG